MKAVTLAVVVLLVPVVGFGAQSIPESFRDYIKTPSETVEVRKVYVPRGALTVPETISRSEALEDIEMLAYLFQNGYSGREFYEMRGVDFQAIYQNLRDAVEQFEEPVDVLRFENEIAKAFGGLFDGHLSLRGRQSHRFYKHQDVYFADILIEEQEGTFVVIDSAVSDVQPGDRFTQTDPEPFLFRTLSPQGRTHYLVGMLSDGYCSEQKLSFNDRDIVVALHPSRLSQAASPNEICALTECDGVDVLNMQRFPPSPMTDGRVEPYVKMAQSLKESPAFVLDLRGNPGGSSEYSRTFFETLNRVAHWNMSFAFLRSPVTQVSTSSGGGWLQRLADLLGERSDQTPGTRTWQIRAIEQEQQTGDYPGKVIVLMDRHIASSGEAAVAYSKSVRDSLRVGENSAGIGTFGEVRGYYLPNSKIRVNLPCKVFLSSESPEGRGYLPDYWLDTDQPVQEIVRWLHDPQGYRVAFPEPAVLSDMNFDRWNDGIPEHASKIVGATNNRQGKHAQIVQDTETKTQGTGSVRFSGDAETGIWYCLQQPVPQSLDSLRARYAVKGSNLRREANQFSSCYVGFIYKDRAGQRQFYVQSYRDTFDWKEAEITLDCRDKSEIVFTIFSNISGDLWVDDVRFVQE